MRRRYNGSHMCQNIKKRHKTCEKQFTYHKLVSSMISEEPITDQIGYFSFGGV